MKRYSNAKGSWFSHKTAEGIWCNGKNGKGKEPYKGRVAKLPCLSFYLHLLKIREGYLPWHRHTETRANSLDCSRTKHLQQLLRRGKVLFPFIAYPWYVKADSIVVINKFAALLMLGRFYMR